MTNEEKIAIAKYELKKIRIDHKNNCMVEVDPEGYAPCSCGATKINNKIYNIIEILK
jgi:hypothetical protein